MDVDAIASFIATKAAGVAGVRGASPRPIDTLPATPYAVVSPVRSGSVIPGSWERVHMTFPLRLYVARTADASRTASLVNGFVAAFIAAFRAGGTESSTVSSTLITSWDTDVYEEVGAELYQCVDFAIEVVSTSAAGYTP